MLQGMLEGVFPRRRSEDPILTDLERAEISLYLETRPLPDSHREARRERDQFYRLVRDGFEEYCLQLSVD